MAPPALYPGTAVARLAAVTARASSLSRADLSGPWADVRRKLLWAGGLFDIEDAAPGAGYTGHAFNDYNHCDLTTMLGDVQDESNADGAIAQISRRNQLGPGIRVASDPALGPGGSWSTCTNGCNTEPPSDVAHVQFQARIAFKLVWSPADDFKSHEPASLARPNGDAGPLFNAITADYFHPDFVLVDDAGKLLAAGTPSPPLPQMKQRQMNYQVVQGSKYATEAENLACAAE